IKKEFSNSNFELIGYSGGGTVATLLASKRTDISSLTTVVGNLDIQKWVKMQNITPLIGSLNPSDFIQNLENIKQHHLIGENDKIIPK
ncbi:alpha/beta fold hydrolase, partial [Aliarcobacter butzleri]